MNADIAIVGGGMVGASLGVALAPLGLRIVLIESVPHDAAAQPSFDERTTALSNGSRRILETLGVWQELAAGASPIAKIHVSDKGRFGFARLDAAEQGLAALGHVIPNRALGRALWSRLAGCSNVQVLCPAKVVDVALQEASVALRAESQQPPLIVKARLAVAADGAGSALRTAAGMAADSRDYRQTALITTVLPQRFHNQVAYERFTPSGPLALLPLSDGRCTLVLTLNTEDAAQVLAMNDAQFIAELQRRFGFRLGRFLQVGRRSSYPLSITRAERLSAGRCVVIGNAAQSLHPVAGMGFNLGLRDVASLAELIAERIGSESFDPASTELLAEYDAWRAADRRGVIAFTDGLVRAFSNPLAALSVLRNVGLLAFDLLPPAKAALSRLSTGATGRTPKLARGVALS
jgi:2-octaprenyl-6-methoxyphenol hydroxylase